jgi:AcrR family transcriptional regulator
MNAVMRKNEAMRREQALNAARQVFLRYGYKRTTMGDIADEAHMSRPALYLLFPSKEGAFGAVMEQLFAGLLTLIREGIATRPTAYEQLVFAFEVWAIEPFNAVQAAPDAKDVLESSYMLAPAITANAMADFERLLVSILAPLAREAPLVMSPERLARLLATAVPGFKQAASSMNELQRLIEDLVTLVLACVHATP